MRAQILNDAPAVKEEQTLGMVASFQHHFSLGDPPDYEPTADKSILERAKRSHRTPQEIAYDTLLERDGREIIYMPLAYRNYSFDAILPQLANPNTVLSLSDGGAHCGVICDASMPTYLLTHWVRDRSRGERIPLEFAVKRQTHDTAQLYGLQRSRDARAGDEGGRQPDRIRTVCGCIRRRWFSICRRTAAASCNERTATNTRSSAARLLSKTASRPARCPVRSSAVRRVSVAVSRERIQEVQRTVQFMQITSFFLSQ